MFEIIGKWKIWFSISGILIGLGIIFVSIFGFNFGIDFTGGTLIEVSLPQKATIFEIRETLSNLGLENLSLQSSGERDFFLRMRPITKETHEKVLGRLKEKFGEELKENRYETVGPTVSRNLQKKAIIALLLAWGFIILYISWAFRKASYPVSSWKYGICSVLALIHDVLIAVGVFSIVGRALGWQVDGLFIGALLSIIGFSNHDTIVVFDRIRENLKIHPGSDFSSVVNFSVVQTTPRSLITNLTIIITLFALFIFGGLTIKHFIFTLIVGMIAGTYSSIFIASPLLVLWQKWGRK